MSTPSRKLSYEETRKATRTAQALFEAEYDDAYVLQALIKTGLTQAQGEWILLHAELENLKHRKKVNGAIALVMGIGWVIIFALFYITKDNPVSNSRAFVEPAVPIRYWGIAMTVFIGGLANYLHSFWRVKKMQGTFPEEPPLS